MKPFGVTLPEETDARITRLERQLLRERAARLAAESIAEQGLRDLYESKRRLVLLQRITEQTNSAKDVRDALRFALGAVCAEMGWDFGNAYLVAADGTATACDCWHAASPDHMMEFVEASRTMCVRRGEGLPGRVVADPRAHWVADVRADAQFFRRSAAVACRVVAGCAFPIVAGDEVVAVYEFFSRRAIIANPGMVETMAHIGVQLGRVVERVRARAALLHDATHDALTGLPNRVLLADHAATAFTAMAKGHVLAMLVMDLDGFKAVNDKLGHHAGDCVLVEAARRLREALAAASGGMRAMLARTGGDEFVALLSGAPGTGSPDAVAAALHAALAPPFLLGRDEAAIGTSIGIATGGPGYTDVDQVLRDGDLAMYAAKASGRNKTVRFTPDLGVAVRRRMSLEHEIREAIRERQFVLHYQPIVTLGSGEVAGFEALARWQHPVRGLLPPSEFIPVAEETGLIVFLGDWVLREACSAIARLHAAQPGGPLPFVAVNIAPQQFLQPNFIHNLRAVVMETGVPPGCLKLEVTEGVAIIDAERTRDVLEQCRAMGVRTGLDDFGTGYSSLAYLHSLPFDVLKIDRSFVASIDQPKSQQIVRTILDLARNLGLRVVAEGIETDAQAASLDGMGCVMGQGFYMGRPLSEDEAFAPGIIRPSLAG